MEYSASYVSHVVTVTNHDIDWDSIDRGTFLIFAVACALGYVWSTYSVPETANVSLEEIDAVFESSAGLEDIALKQQVSRVFPSRCYYLLTGYDRLRSRSTLVCTT